MVASQGGAGGLWHAARLDSGWLRHAARLDSGWLRAGTARATGLNQVSLVRAQRLGSGVAVELAQLLQRAATVALHASKGRAYLLERGAQLLKRGAQLLQGATYLGHRGEELLAQAIRLAAQVGDGIAQVA